MTGRSEWARHIGWFAVLGAASLLTVLCVGLFFAAISNDNAIESHFGTATATVESVSFDRTIIQFPSPDGIVHSPANGVLYPSGLSAGQLVAIEYDTTNPDRVARVAGRTATLTILPLGTTILFTWLVAGPLLWWLRRLIKRDRAAHAPAETPEPAAA